MINQSSLFIAAGICAAALALTMLSVWLHHRADRFMIGWTSGMLMLGLGVLIYYTLPPDNMMIVAGAFGLETVGFVIVYRSARAFVGRPMEGRPGAILFTGALLPVIIPILLGFDGLGITIYNALAATMLSATAVQYWTVRHEARSSLTGLTVLYGSTAASFVACAAVLMVEGQWVLLARPDNWAEELNAIACIAGITGVGALSLGLNHARAARRHREEARTDALTGLLNRRALFDEFAGQALGRGDIVVVLDLDRFKSINDRHGHAIGDEILRRFGVALKSSIRDDDYAARTGGEEFVIVLRNANLQIATDIAERARALLARSTLETPDGVLSATASAGIAVSDPKGELFEAVLHRADTSLYRAKDGGRNRVAAALQAVA